jgi:hypothetical protein
MPGANRVNDYDGIWSFPQPWVGTLQTIYTFRRGNTGNIRFSRRMTMCRIGIMLIFAVAALLGSLVFPPNAYSQVTDQKEVVSDPLREQQIRDFKEWRAGIPDYERRLYKRVKKLNARTLDILRLVMGSFVITVLIILMTAYAILKRINRTEVGATTMGVDSEPVEREDVATRPSTGDGPSLPRTVIWGGYQPEKKIMRRQQHIMDSIKRINEYIAYTEATTKEFSTLARSLEKDAKALAAEIETLKEEKS